MFDKVTTLSVESLAKTSSGKLIAMISSDLFALERSFTFAALILVFPVCNLFTFLYVGSRFGWIPALIVLACFLFSFGLQMLAGHYQKILKGDDARQTDDRLKLVSDVVVGIRTIKCYGWENHYLKKLATVRKA